MFSRFCAGYTQIIFPLTLEMLRQQTTLLYFVVNFVMFVFAHTTIISFLPNSKALVTNFLSSFSSKHVHLQQRRLLP